MRLTNTKKKKIFYEDLIITNPNPSYGDLLFTLDWEIRRHEIFKRDEYKCTKCNSTQRLIVHHKKYKGNLLPWKYVDEDLTTLCETCHAGVHGKMPNPFYVPKTWFRDRTIK